MKARGRRLPRWALAAAGTAVAVLAPAAWVEPVRLWIAGAVAPVRDLSGRVVGAARRIFGGSDDAHREWEAREAYYRELVERQAAELALLRQRVERIARTRQAVPAPARLVAAAVVLAGDASGRSETMVVDAGSGAGVARGQAVMWEQHLIGRVTEVGPWSARVALTTDPGFRIGAVAVPRDGEDASGYLLVVQGRGGGRLRLKWAPPDDATEAGWIVVTAGDPQLGLPRGLLIGRVARVESTGGPFREIEVDPAVRFDRIAEVVIVVPEGGS